MNKKRYEFYKSRPSDEDNAELQQLAELINGKPLIFFAHTDRSSIDSNGDMTFYSIQIYNPHFCIDDSKVIAHHVIIKDAGKAMQGLLAQTPEGAAKPYVLFLLGYPIVREFDGRQVGSIRFAYDLTDIPVFAKSHQPLMPPMDLIEKCCPLNMQSYLFRTEEMPDPTAPALSQEFTKRMMKEADGRPILLTATYSPKRQLYPEYVCFYGIRPYHPRYNLHQIELVQKFMLVANAKEWMEREVGDRKIINKTQLLIAGYPEIVIRAGIPQETVGLAIDITERPLQMQDYGELYAPEELLAKCYLPDITPYLRSGAVSRPPYPDPALSMSVEERRIARKERKRMRRQEERHEQHRQTKYERNYLRSSLEELASLSVGRPVVLYGAFDEERVHTRDRTCFRNIKPYLPGHPYGAIKQITGHLMIQDGENRAYSYGPIRQKVRRYGALVLLIGYPEMYVSEGILRYGFRLADDIGSSAIVYNEDALTGQLHLPDSLWEICYHPETKRFLNRQTKKKPIRNKPETIHTEESQ